MISPLLSNIYLHEVLDSWFASQVRPRMIGKAELIRFADDCAPRPAQRGGGHVDAYSKQPCCTRDERGPLGAAVQAEAPNHLKLLWSKAMVVSVKEKVPQDGIR